MDPAAIEQAQREKRAAQEDKQREHAAKVAAAAPAPAASAASAPASGAKAAPAPQANPAKSPKADTGRYDSLRGVAEEDQHA
jgi:hypothetical protein